MLYHNTYSRSGNDSWLHDDVSIYSDEIGYYLLHKWKYSGWAGTDVGSNILELDEFDLDKSQKIVDEYLNDRSLNCEYPSGGKEGIFINLSEINH